MQADIEKNVANCFLAIVFCATRVTSFPSATNVIVYEEVTVNAGNGFDEVSNRFSPPASGIYWIHISGGLLSATAADVRLNGAERTPNILRKHSSWNGYDTSSRDEIVTLSPALNVLAVSSDSGLYSDVGRQTAFCGFQINNVMETVCAFSVGRSTDWSTAGKIQYDLINVDTNSGWSTTDNQFIVPYTGTWVITFSIGAISGGDAQVDLYAPTIIASILFLSTNNAGADMASKTIIVPINAGAAVYTYLSNAPVYSDIRYQTALMGFYYAPNRLQPITWSVATVSQLIGPVDPVPFDIVLSNEGNGWSVVTNIYLVPAAGVYYLSITAGIVPNDNTLMELLVNGDVKASIYRSGTTHNGVDTRSRAIILSLQTNDQLTIRLPSDYALYSDSSRITAFSGFRIYL